MPRLEFFFDCSSPWTYLGFTGIQPIAQRAGVQIEWRPIIVGGVFNAVNQAVYAGREAMFSNEKRLAHYLKDLGDWSQLYGLNISWPSFHPVNSVKPMRGCIVAQEHDLLVPFATGVFEAYWGREEDISNEDVLARIAEGVGLDAAEFFTKIASQPYKDKLRANTDELIERGGYGSPTLFIDEHDMYFGNDRLPLVENKLGV